MAQITNRKKAEALVEQMKAIAEKPGIMTSADDREFWRLSNEFNKLVKNEDDRELPSGVFDLSKVDSLKRGKLEQLALCEFVRSGNIPQELVPLMKSTSLRTAQQSTSVGSGGYFVPSSLTENLEVALKGAGGMWENARIIRTDRGNTTAWGYTNDTDNKAYIVTEAADAAADAEPVTFNLKNFNGFKYTSGVIKVSNELLQDSELFAQEFVSVLTDRFFRGTNEHFTTGDGSGKPKGAAFSAVYGNSTTADGDISNTDILNLIYSVDSGYRKNGKFMLHSSTLEAIQRKVASTSEEKPFWVPPQNTNESPSGSLWGYPIVINDDMASFVGAGTSADDNKKAMLFGDFSKYIIRQARDLRIVRFPQRYAESDETAFAVFLRVDGDILNAGTNPIKYMRVSTT